MELFLCVFMICVISERTTLIDGLLKETRTVDKTVRSRRSIPTPDGVEACNCTVSKYEIEQLKSKSEELKRENGKLKSRSNNVCDTRGEGLVCRNNQCRCKHSTWNGTSCVRPAECADVAYHSAGIYYIYPTGYPVAANCVYREGKIWTVFQRRTDGSFGFDRKWNEYKAGFGDPYGKFWLGNNIVHTLTKYNGPHRLRIELTDKFGWGSYAAYSHFEVESEIQQFALKVAEYSGNAGDILNNGKMFSTSDYDNDGDIYHNYAADEHCGWWYGGYGKHNLNMIRNSWDVGHTIDYKETSLMMLTRS